MAWNARPEEAYSVGAIRQSDVRKRIRKGSIMLMLALLTAFITRSRYCVLDHCFVVSKH